MDIERVNIVFNYDMPENSDSYLHRVARAGRFGTKVCRIGFFFLVDFLLTVIILQGLGITFVSDETDAKVLNDVQERFDVSITQLPDEIDLSSYSKFRVFVEVYFG